MERLLAGRTPTGAGPFWLITMARYDHEQCREQAALRYADWFARGVSSVRAVGGKVMLRLIDADVNVLTCGSTGSTSAGGGDPSCGRRLGCDALTVVELPSPAALQEMRAKYEYVKRGASPAALSRTFYSRVGESVVRCAEQAERLVERDAGNLHGLTGGDGIVVDGGQFAPMFDFFQAEKAPISLRLLSLRGLNGAGERGYAEIAEISDGVQFSTLFSSTQMKYLHHGRL